MLVTLLISFSKHVLTIKTNVVSLHYQNQTTRASGQRKIPYKTMAIKSYEKVHDAINEVRAEIEEILKHQQDNIIFTTNQSFNDTIYGYMYDGNRGGVREYEVKAIRYKHGQIEVLLGNQQISYTKEDVETTTDDEWEPLFGGDVLGWFTAIEIAEALDQYIYNYNGGNRDGGNDEEKAFYCPECGVKLEHGDYYFDYDSGKLYMERCSNCGNECGQPLDYYEWLEKFGEDSYEDKEYDELFELVAGKGGYAVCEKDKRPTFLIEGRKRVIKSVFVNGCDDSSPLKMIDVDEECWDVDDYLSNWQIQTLSEIIS